MAFVRPSTKKNRTKGSREFDDNPDSTPNKEEEPEFTFASDYYQMHDGAFAKAWGQPQAKQTSGIQGPKGCTLETLVSTLAELHFTTKGKIGEDGKFELIFCSPEPVVREVRRVREDDRSSDRPHRSRRERSSKNKSILF